jgi:hypothetical protein
MVSGVAIKSAKLVFPGLNEKGIPTGFTVATQDGAPGTLRVNRNTPVATEAGTELNTQAITAVGGPNVMISQNITVDGNGTTYSVTGVSAGVAGSWTPLDLGATTADFEQMEHCCTRAEAATSVEEFEVWDGMFHEIIARAAHNAFVARLFKLMNQARAQGEWGMLKKRSLTPERRLAYQSEHRALLKAIKARDPLLAKTLATEHLIHVRRNLLNY